MIPQTLPDFPPRTRPFDVSATVRARHCVWERRPPGISGLRPDGDKRPELTIRGFWLQPRATLFTPVREWGPRRVRSHLEMEEGGAEWKAERRITALVSERKCHHEKRFLKARAIITTPDGFPAPGGPVDNGEAWLQPRLDLGVFAHPSHCR
ncbi:hypothetical protein EYF80_057723 [Liparis tanakae]|uniref:Uncharacterized protein n=1 Tax=Liparis tanakae TaxID=230148 RepID=A0A4Z2ETK6_9TELE|nr:hypothetical protein EYF80_057723 [Liparis tanakae]